MEEKRCYGCMRIKGPGEVCPHCGYRENTPNAPHQLAAGAVLREQYLIGRVLGQGGFGITYLGWDLYLDMPVAIKEYYPGGMVMRDTTVTMAVTDITGEEGRFHHSRDRFMREAKMLARFSQMEEVVQVKNFFLANNTAYIVMEYVEGITLKQHVQDCGGKIPPREAFAILGPIIRALSKVHKTGIIHRDISPDNIMMLPQGGAKLLDFGAVRSVGEPTVGKELTKSTEAILKQGYAPLEQYQKKGALGPWTDVYALCATLYFCITGNVPPDAPARVLGYEELDLESLCGIPEKQRAALLHGLELRADIRTPDMQTLFEELFISKQPQAEVQPVPKTAPVEPQPIPRTRPVTREEPQETEAQPREKRAPRKPRKKNPLPIIAAAAVLALVLAVAWGITRPQTPHVVQQVELGGAILYSGTCGENLQWSLDENGVLAVSGTGAMDNYDALWEDGEIREDMNLPPWQEYKDQIRKVILADGVETAGSAAFMNCVNLEEVNFWTTVYSIETYAFCNTGLAELVLPQSLLHIGSGAFENTQVSQVTIPNNVDTVEYFAFGNCPNLEVVTLGQRATLCFDSRFSLSTFSRPDNDPSRILLRGPGGGMAEDYARIYGHPFEAVGKTHFDDQGYMGDLYGGGNVAWYFDRETQYLKLEGEGEVIEEMRGSWESQVDDPPQRDARVAAVPWTVYQDEIRVAYISPGITQIPQNCFENCHNLTDIYIPDTVRFIGFQAFLATNVDEIVLPESVETIEPHAFNYCHNLHLVYLPMGLRDLERGVFNMCTNLHRLYMGNNITIHYELDHSVSPFTNGPEEAEFPKDLVLCSPQERSGDQVAPAKIFADAAGIGYEECMFQFEDAQAVGQAVFGKSDIYWAVLDGTLILRGKGETPFFRAEDSDRRAWGVRQPEWMLVKDEAPWYPYRNMIHTVLVYPGITVLNRGALCDMPNLGYADLGEVHSIGTGAVDNCGMEHLWTGDRTHTIETLAITDCPNLRSLEIHNGCGYIGSGALRGNTALEGLWFYGGGEYLAGELFDGHGPENLTIYARPGAAAEQYAAQYGYPCETVPW